MDNRRSWMMWFAVAALIFAALACGPLGGATTSNENQAEETEQPEETEAPEVTEQPTEVPTVELTAEPTEVAGGGELDFSLDPTYGGIQIETGFTPDPIIAAVTSGGSVNVTYLGGECSGYAATGPDFSIIWTGPGLLRFYFVPDDPSVDTALVVNDAGMNWRCNNDWQSGDTAPMLDLESAADGRIDVWVASANAGESVSGTLYITQLTDLNPSNPGEGASWEELPNTATNEQLEILGDPTYGLLDLGAGFTDPTAVTMAAGGSIDASYIGQGCFGYAAQAPDVSISWSGAGTLRIFFVPDDGTSDTLLLVNDAAAAWHCNDDWQPGNLNPLVDLENAGTGRIDIWVGTLSEGNVVSGTLYITQNTSLTPDSVAP